MEKTLLINMLQRVLTALVRLDSSPEENFLKKLRGRASSRIITEASTAREVLIEIRSIRRERTTDRSWDAIIAEMRKIAVPISSEILLLSRTGPVTI